MLLPLSLTLAMALGLVAKSASGSESMSVARKSLTIAQLVEKAMKVGVDKPLSLSGDKKLGYAISHPCKKLQYENTVSGDGYHHRFQVVLSEIGAPLDVIIGKVRTRELAFGPVVESYAYRMDISGNLIAAIHGVGHPNRLTKKILNVADPETIAAFKREREFFTSKSHALPQAKLE